MSELEALLLGIVQGLTEFLPISSSGHLIIVPWLQDYTFLIENPDFNKTFDVALHAGTLVAAIAYFRREVVALTRGFVEVLRRRAIETPDQRLSVAIALGTVPAVIAGGLGSAEASMTMVPPSGIASLALMHRLSTASSSWFGSASTGGSAGGMSNRNSIDAPTELAIRSRMPAISTDTSNARVSSDCRRAKPSIRLTRVLARSADCVARSIACAVRASLSP